MVETELLRTEDAAKLLNVHVNTIRSWIEKGKLPTVRVGKNYRIPRRELEALIKQPLNKGPHIIAVANQKGGVAKTTTTLNLAAALASKDCRVLVVDLDPQGGCAVSLGIDPGSLAKTLYNVLLFDEVKPQDALVPTAAGFDLLPSNIDLAAAEVELKQQMASEQVLKFNLGFIEKDYDFILLDCPPSLGVLTVSGFNAAHEVLIPMATEPMALRGLQMLVRTIEKVRSYLNPDLKILGVLGTRYKPHTLSGQEVMKALEAATKESGVRLFTTAIKESVRFAESPSAKKPLVLFDPTHDGAKAYYQVAQEIISSYV